LNELDEANAPLLLPGAPVGWRASTAPEGWAVSKLKVSPGELNAEFKDIDNPGNWLPFSFQPKFLHKNQKAVKHLHHAMPAGCTPFPKDDDGIRSSDGLQFCHNGWTRDSSDPPFESGTARENLHPLCRKGCLDASVLAELGMTCEQMIHTDGAPDALFFCQLLLPIHDTLHEGTFAGNPRMPHCPHVSECTEVHAMTELCTRGSGCGHRFRETLPCKRCSNGMVML